MDEGGVPISYSSVHLHSQCYSSAARSCKLSISEVFGLHREERFQVCHRVLSGLFLSLSDSSVSIYTT